MRPQKPAIFIAVAALYVLMVAVIPALFYVGFTNSDDVIYAGRALQLIGAEPFSLPDHHWGFRYPVVYPLAVILYFFEWSELTSVILPVIYFLVTATVLGFACARYFGTRAFVISVFLVLSCPLLVVQSTIINVDIPEAMFLTLSMLLLCSAIGKDTDKVRNRLLLSGVMCGIAMTTRETAYGMLLVYGLLFLRGAYFPRLQYLWGGLGVVAVLAIEWGSYMAYGESPLYRFMTSAQSHGTIGIRSGDFNAGSGNISDNRLWGPLLALLVNQEFGLLFYAAPVAVFGLLRSRNLTEQQRQLVKVFSFSALVWFLWVGYSGAVRPLPRYFAYDAFIALILVGAWLACVVGPRWRIIVLAGLVLSNYAFLSVENTHPRFAERSISAFAMATDEKIATDPLTNRRVGGYFRIEGRDPKEFMNTAPNLEESMDGRKKIAGYRPCNSKGFKAAPTRRSGRRSRPCC